MDNYSKQCGLLEINNFGIDKIVWPAVDKSTPGIIYHDWVNGIRPLLQELFTTKSGSVIQAGGNCGMYPLLYREFFEHVYTFEPDPLSFFCLTVNCQSPDISMMNCALGDEPGLVHMQELIQENRGMNRVEKTAQHGIPMVKLDGFHFEDVRLVQLDLEGFEPNALKGGIELLRKHKPILIMECTDNFDEVTEIIYPLGYEKYKQITRLDTVFVPKG